jgi:hypothetical protein
VEGRAPADPADRADRVVAVRDEAAALMPAPEGYIDVSERIHRFYEKHPNGSLDSEWRTCELGERTFVVCEARAYRDADDQLPGVGIAWEPFPGPTPFTRDSELQNAQTSAWGRAIVALGFLSKDEGIASSQDVQNRRAADELPAWVRPAEGALLEQAKAAVKELADGHASLLAQTIKEANGGTLPKGVAVALVNTAAAVAAREPQLDEDEGATAEPDTPEFGDWARRHADPPEAASEALSEDPE